MRKLLRDALAFATLVVVWLVVSPARAAESAPMCDPRGAITFAPPPQIQDEERSLDIPADCYDVNPLETKNYVPGHPAPPPPNFAQDPLAPSGIALLSLTFRERVPFVATVDSRPPPAARSPHERPPRG